nr:NADH dehydrogenase subunit 2 [Campanulotes compar]
MMFFSVVVTLSSSSWLVCWMMMEVSSFFFIPIIYGLWSLSSAVSSMKYFFVQSIGSSVFLFSILWDSVPFGGWEWVSEEKEMGVITCLSMMFKLGVFPFMGWMVQISENLSWSKFFLLSSIQEVIPLLMISKFGSSEGIIFFFVCLGMFVLVMFCFSSYSIHWMMMVSSLFNVGWMVVAALLSKESLIFFFFVYFSMLYVFFWVLDEIVSIGSMTTLSSFSVFKGGKTVFLFFVFMMMGIPPLGNFLGKVEVLTSMISEDMIWMSVYFVFMSSVFMFLYLKISLSISMSMKGGEAKLKVPYLKAIMMGFLFLFFLIWMF